MQNFLTFPTFSLYFLHFSCVLNTLFCACTCLFSRIEQSGSLKAKKICSHVRVWKGIFGIRDLTKIRCGNRENDKYIDGIRDLTVPREPGLAKNWARDAGFMFVCLSGMAETVATHRSG